MSVKRRSTTAVTRTLSYTTSQVLEAMHQFDGHLSATLGKSDYLKYVSFKRIQLQMFRGWIAEEAAFDASIDLLQDDLSLLHDYLQIPRPRHELSMWEDEESRIIIEMKRRNGEKRYRVISM